MFILNVEFKGKKYELGFTRNTVVMLERNGFNLDELTLKPMTMLPMFWQGAFAAYNKGVKRSVMDEIYKNIRDKQGLISALIELYAETINTLTEDPEEENEGNATWEIVR